MEVTVGDLAHGQAFLIPGRKGLSAGPWSKGAELPSGRITARHVQRLSYEARLDPATPVVILPAGSPAGG